ncbi:MAG: alkene reductase [Nitrospirota bacterium]|nr:alkene reductase [Nitrospirota bacterium]
MSEPTLFEADQVGDIPLNNRVVMAPMTRNRADASGVPQPCVATYYTQRASAGLIISEAVAVCRQGAGYPLMPGIWNDAQEAGWRQVIDAVHRAGGRFVLQLMHTGRIGHSSLIGETPVSASAITPAGEVMAADFSMQPFETPLALDEAGIEAVIADYKNAAERAMRAGADGVEVHGANGYLPDQFLRTGTNLREDDWGGGPAGRGRLLMEITRAVTEKVGAARTGVRLSPWNPFNGMSDRNPGITFRNTAEQLARFRIAYMHVNEMGAPSPTPGPQQLTRDMARVFGGRVLINAGYTAERAALALADRVANVAGVVFGVPFIANPDLVRRLKEGIPLAEADPDTFYTGGEKGYTDYPAAG